MESEKLQKFFFCFSLGGGGKKKKEKETRNRIVHTFEFENGDGWIFHEVCGKFGREKKCGKFENLGVVLERKQVLRVLQRATMIFY